MDIYLVTYGGNPDNYDVVRRFPGDDSFVHCELLASSDGDENKIKRIYFSFKVWKKRAKRIDVGDLPLYVGSKVVTGAFEKILKNLEV